LWFDAAMETTCRYCQGVAERTEDKWDGAYVWVCHGCIRRMIYNFQYKLVGISPGIKPRPVIDLVSAVKTLGIQCVKEVEAAPQEQH